MSRESDVIVSDEVEVIDYEFPLGFKLLIDQIRHGNEFEEAVFMDNYTKVETDPYKELVKSLKEDGRTSLELEFLKAVMEKDEDESYGISVYRLISYSTIMGEDADGEDDDMTVVVDHGSVFITETTCSHEDCVCQQEKLSCDYNGHISIETLEFLRILQEKTKNLKNPC